MGRARGKHTDRVPTVDQEDPQARGIGMSPRTQGIPSPIPGGRPHLSNPETVRHKVAGPAPRGEYRGVNAHGVPPGTATTRDRAEMMRGPNDVRGPDPGQRLTSDPILHPDPVPVYLVEQGGGGDTVRSNSPRHITVPASTADPVRLCGQSKARVRIKLLNESTSSDIRLAQRPSDLVSGGGALLPWPLNSYLDLVTQDELWAVSADSGTPKISIIEEFEQQW
jgi:hypothetical protein